MGFMMAYLSDYQERFCQVAKKYLPNDTNHIGKLYKAIHYSFFAAGGKRLRPALIYAMADSLGIKLNKVDNFALAIESIHTYSLIHDDLPAMDNDDFRRGQPACHKQFDYATAILAGDALNTFAFEILSSKQDNISLTQQLKQIQLLAECAGASGMVGGQDTDLSCEKTPNNVTLATLTKLHQQKTAKLIQACLLGAYICCDNVDEKKYELLSKISLSIGLFYQIQDDILDVTQTSEILGKPSGSDNDKSKVTYVSLLGLEQATMEANHLKEQIIDDLQSFFDNEVSYHDTPLSFIIDIIMKRKN